MSDANIQIVKDLYATFQRGDIEGVVAECAPDIEWHSGGGPHHPTFFEAFGPRRGPAQVHEFFRLVSELRRFDEFQPLGFYADQDKVFVPGHALLTILPTDRQVRTDWMHVFTLRNGKVAAFREYFDTEAVAAAYRGHGTA